MTGFESDFSFSQLLIVPLFRVQGDKANKEQYLSLFYNTVTFKQGKWELSNRDFDIADDDGLDYQRKDLINDEQKEDGIINAQESIFTDNESL